MYSGFRTNTENCSFCEQPIIINSDNSESLFSVEVLDRKYHIGCFRCTICGICLAGKEFTIDDKYRVVCAPVDDSNNELRTQNCLEKALGIDNQNGKFMPVSKHGLNPLKKSNSGRSSPALSRQNVVKYTWGNPVS